MIGCSVFERSAGRVSGKRCRHARLTIKGHSRCSLLLKQDGWYCIPALQKKLQVKNVPSATCEEEQGTGDLNNLESCSFAFGKSIRSKWESLSGNASLQARTPVSADGAIQQLYILSFSSERIKIRCLGERSLPPIRL